jgi:non-heme chloroperoxidase
LKLELIHEPSRGARRDTLLFVHGAYLGAWCWAEHFMPYLAGHGYETYALSLRGHGKSPGSASCATLDDFVNDLDEAVRTLPEAPILAGHSMGGAVVQRYARRDPVRAFALLAAVPPYGLFPVNARLTFTNPGLLAGLALSGVMPRSQLGGVAREALFSPGFDSRTLHRYMARVGEPPVRAIADLMYMAPGRELSPPQAPLVLGGANDALFAPADIMLTARLNRTRAEIVPGVAHAMMLDAGWQAVADRILAWLPDVARSRAA